MKVRTMIRISTLAGMTIGLASATTRAMPQQRSDAKSDDVAATTATATASSEGQSTKTNWTPVQPQSSSEDKLSSTSRWKIKDFASDFAGDQKDIWTSPAKVRFSDSVWLVPFAGLTAGLFIADRETSRHRPSDPQTVQRYREVADAGVGALAGIGGGLAIWSLVSRDEHQRETGFLAGEAALDSLVVVEALKYAAGRQRPYEADGDGHFFRGGSSFPSENAAAAWAIAGVVAHEYPGLLPKFMAYGFATAVSLSRVQSRDHFASDVLVGSAIGWLVSRHVYTKHHDPELGGDTFNTPEDLEGDAGWSGTRNPGSPYVPLDSWVYQSLERLAALGYINMQFLGMRPWTRTECAAMVQEAGDNIRSTDATLEQASGMYAALVKEFQPDLNALVGDGTPSVRLESLYSGTTEIAGRPLNDGYHFGQTVINNYGRPYEQGFNSYDGFSTYATAGRFTIYVRGEYQHSPAAPAYSESVRQLISTLDVNPVQSGNPTPSLNQFALIDAYVAGNYGGWDMSLGKQSLWWGPGEGSSFLISDNAEPMYMFRVNRIVPIELPWIFHRLGPMKVDAFFGQLAGNEFPPGPVLHGEKISFKPTVNLELGFTRTVELGGAGRPLTLNRFFRSYFVLGYVDNATSANSPGIRDGGFDLAYRVPFLRDWLTVYFDSIYRPVKGGISPGFYLSHFPKIPKLDLRLEAETTDPFLSRPDEFVYFDGFYHDFYTNHNNLVGSWVGRRGQGEQAWSNYWFTPRNRLQLNYRHQKVSKDFIPGGGTLTDVGMRADWWVRPTIGVSAQVQYEVWNFPVIQPGAQRDVSSSLQITFTPSDRWTARKRRGESAERSSDQP
jgi:hypothetical protein